MTSCFKLDSQDVYRWARTWADRGISDRSERITHAGLRRITISAEIETTPAQAKHDPGRDPTMRTAAQTSGAYLFVVLVITAQTLQKLRASCQFMDRATPVGDLTSKV